MSGPEEIIDLTNIPGTPPISPDTQKPRQNEPEDDLDALAELVPDVRTRKNNSEKHNSMTLGDEQLPQEGKGIPGNEEGKTRRMDSMMNQSGGDGNNGGIPMDSQVSMDDSSGSDGLDGKNIDDVLYGDQKQEDVNSDRALSSDHSKPRPPDEMSGGNMGMGGEFPMSSAQSLSTATQTHEVRMPMYLPTFKPATGCTNASDFIVRCFVARLRSGITVVKHGRSRWCKSRLRILHIHPDGRSLSWKPAQGEPSSNKRPPKLDLTTCLEVRHAWSPDPGNPMYTGTPILRQKCEAANAHKSFALIFPKRTVDITSVTADQCKVLMEGFSALCFRLQVANLVGKGNKKGGQKMPEEEEVATTASATLTNNSVVSPHTGGRR